MSEPTEDMLRHQIEVLTRERDEAMATANFRKSISSGEYCPHACEFPLMERLRTDREQALRELGEANTARVDLQRFIAGLTEQLNAALRSTAELRGALEDCAAMADARADSFIKTGEQIGWAERENLANNMHILAKAIRARTALAPSSTKEA